MPDAYPGASGFREAAQSKCAWTFPKSHFAWKFARKMPDATNTYEYHLDWTPRLNTCGFCSSCKNDGRMMQDAYHVAGAVQRHIQQTCLEVRAVISYDFLRRVAFGTITSSGLLRWLAYLASLFCGRRSIREMGRKNRITHWYKAISSARTRLSSFEGSLAESHTFLPVFNMQNWGSLCEFRRFGAVNLNLLLGHLAELLHFGPVNFHFYRKPRIIACFWIDK